MEEVCVQLPTYQRGNARGRLPLLRQSIDTFYPPGPQQQTRGTMLQWANGTDAQMDRQTKKQTDTVPFYRPMRATPKKYLKKVAPPKGSPYSPILDY